ncbi:GNAT family N-acetyltransferase [Photobacterium profundum]|uniref:tRNA(Met) cytidine acetyltransferase TmcA n=1 Tax=Photobacterium profundum TaxID=74109 RepID=UPI003D0C09CE
MSITMTDLLPFSSQLIAQAKNANCRHLVVLAGDLAWGTESANSFTSGYPSYFWAGENAPENADSLSIKKAKKLLGQETDCLVFNAHNGFDADAFGAISGTVIGGGLLLLLVPSCWFDATLTQLPFIQRLVRLLSAPDVLLIQQSDTCLPDLPPSYLAENDYQDLRFSCLTQEQTLAVEAIKKVVTGHRKRPLVLTADRGRGKSSALGIAAASLMTERRIRIGVTSPSFANVNTLFTRAAEVLGIDYKQEKSLSFESSDMVFFAPDTLLTTLPGIDFLIVDEAAAIPAPLLSQMLTHYNRVAFASTIHGYEGTGRGFAIKFRQQLDLKTPQWRQLSITQPIRWAINDPLEKWVFSALLLDTDVIPSHCLSTKASSEITYRTVPTKELIVDEVLLSSLFGLLINAHYQTSPNDISQLLDDANIQLLVAELKNDSTQAASIVGCCLVSLEGGFASDLAQQVMLGKRRVKGHLLAQSVAAHIGILQGATQHCARILRIAVHPFLQQQGIGSSLVGFTQEWASQQGLDYIGTSFAAAPELVSFWRKAGFLPIRLGVTKDASSGAHSLLAVQPISDAAQFWLQCAVSLFSANFLSQRVEQFNKLENELFISLFQYSSAQLDISTYMPLPLSFRDLQLNCYCQGGLGYDLAIASIESWLSEWVTSDDFIHDPTAALAVVKVLQKQSWDTVVAQFSLPSRKHAEHALRSYITQHYQSSL